MGQILGRFNSSTLQSSSRAWTALHSRPFVGSKTGSSATSSVSNLTEGLSMKEERNFLTPVAEAQRVERPPGIRACSRHECHCANERPRSHSRKFPQLGSIATMLFALGETSLKNWFCRLEDIENSSCQTTSRGST